MRCAIVVAGGKGQRMGYKKQYASLAGQPMWVRSIQAMFAGDVEYVCLVSPADDVLYIQQQIGQYSWSGSVHVTDGGATRFESVQAGVRHLHERFKAEWPDLYVGVHDAARPFVIAEDVKAVFEAAENHGAAILGQVCTDTVKQVSSGCIERTIPRETLFLAQTPQVFNSSIIERAYLLGSPSFEPTDDASLVESLGVIVHCVLARDYNGKVTTPDDMVFAKWLAEMRWEEGEQA